jgi:hypothetical protein
VEKTGNLKICTLYKIVAKKRGGAEPLGNFDVDGMIILKLKPDECVCK